jgi:hypothetical protein
LLQIAQRQFFFNEFLDASFHPCALFGHERVEDIVEWFRDVQWFDTVDLREAKALLEEFGA